MAIRYRTDIDGLRAVAVFLVFAYHLKSSIFSGGFVGVDVFFVISGYLITGIILKSLSEKSFSLLSFFNRRIKRIIPSVFIVSTATVVASYFILLPDDFSNLIKSYFYTAIYSANLFFYSVTSSYFSTSSDELPLLHMWSLSVEEQYYFIWPLILLALAKFIKNKPFEIVAIAVTISSFLFSHIVSINDQSFSYYMLPTRSGGILLGSMLAILQANHEKIRDYNSKYIVLIGLTLIIASSTYINDTDIFPGFWSLIPSIGACLVLLGGSGYNNNFFSKTLGMKPIAKLGLLSFSIYLWHWPIIAIINYLNIELTSWIIISILLTTVILSYLSFNLLENPIRKSSFDFKRSFFIFNFTFILTGVFLYFISQLTNGFSYRSPDNELNNDIIANRVNVAYADLDAGWCHASSMKEKNIKYTDRLSNCFIGDKKSKKTALFIGDSTAGHYGPFVDKLAKDAGIKVRQLSTSSCYPSIIVKKDGENPDVCLNFRKIIKDAVEKNKYDIIIISNRWVRDSKVSSYKTEYPEEVISFFSDHAKSVFIMGQLPEFKLNPAKCIIRKTCSTSTRFELSADVDQAMSKIRKIAQSKKNVIIIDPSYLLKVNEEYTPFAMGYPMYHDTGHLSIKGMEWLVKKYLKENRNDLK
ncbi:acyltransferase family protein [Morganella morganii]|uniref:acyltransferase family protein n=1 Tax=Morganella morganii TaxID=582 RepID=UPI001BD9B197|nr:acyltransferase family protein [Morganella morganii]MBT0362574.1 acyltransferase [Morganella morganii subsp. morganii]